jgi:hypothetical protein
VTDGIDELLLLKTEDLVFIIDLPLSLKVEVVAIYLGLYLT